MKVTFDLKNITFYEVEKIDRMGTWKLDADRFKRRIEITGKMIECILLTHIELQKHNCLKKITVNNIKKWQERV
jgi:hypothetical protein